MLRLANSSYTYVIITNTGYSYVAAWREGSATLYYLVQPVWNLNKEVTISLALQSLKQNFSSKLPPWTFLYHCFDWMSCESRNHNHRWSHVQQIAAVLARLQPLLQSYNLLWILKTVQSFTGFLLVAGSSAWRYFTIVHPKLIAIWGLSYRYHWWSPGIVL